MSRSPAASRDRRNGAAMHWLDAMACRCAACLNGRIAEALTQMKPLK
jgi:hypothetical protein